MVLLENLCSATRRDRTTHSVQDTVYGRAQSHSHPLRRRVWLRGLGITNISRRGALERIDACGYRSRDTYIEPIGLARNLEGLELSNTLSFAFSSEPSFICLTMRQTVVAMFTSLSSFVLTLIL